jgi:hypothetical protein
MNEYIRRLNKEIIILTSFKQEIRLKISSIIKYWIQDYSTHWVLSIEHIGIDNNEKTNMVKIDSENKPEIEKTLSILDDIMTSYYGTTSGKRKNPDKIGSEIL